MKDISSTKGLDSRRLFWAAGLDQAAARFAAAETARVAKAVDSPRVRWQPASNWHLTLRFLGQAETARAEAMAARLAPALSVLESFAVELGGAAWFPSRERPRVIALPVVAHAPLLALAGVVGEAAFDEGFAREEHPFRGHVSIARVPRGFRPRDLLPSSGAAGTMCIDHVALYESVTTADGPRYQVMLKLPLRATAR